MVKSSELPKKKEVDYKIFSTCDPTCTSTKLLSSRFSITLGSSNIWKFPYMVYKYGGGSFVYSYLLLVIFVGHHLFFMELACGQYTSLGPMTLPRCFPLARGLGVAMIISTLVIITFSNIILVYILYYLLELLGSNRIREECKDPWAGSDTNCLTYLYRCSHIHNNTEQSHCINLSLKALYRFWERRVLDISHSGAMEGFKKDLLLIHAGLWLIMFLICMTVVRCTKNLILHTIGFPLCFLLVTNFIGLTRTNASVGFGNFFWPNWDSFFTLRNWRKAAEYMVFSLNISLGANFFCGSSNHFDASVYNDATMITFIDSFFSILFGLLAFSIMGNLIQDNEKFFSVFRGDESLIFIVFPQLWNHLWMPYMLLACFLMAILYMCMDNMLVLVDMLTTVVGDLWPASLQHYRAILFLTCLVCFLLGLPLVTRGGFYILQTLNKFGAGPTLLLNSFCEIAVTMWGYGFQKILKDFEFMLGSPVPLLTKICLVSVAPAVLLLLLLDWVVDVRQELNQAPTTGLYILGITLLVVGMAMGPLVAVISILWNRKPLLQPNSNWRPEEDIVYTTYLSQKKRYRHNILSWEILKEQLPEKIN